MIHGMVIRGTTPKHDFELPYAKEVIKDLRITYGQNQKALFTKRIEECQFGENKVSVTLTQEETYLFNPNKKLYIEIRIQFLNDEIVRTENPIILRVLDTMDEEVMD